MIRANAGLGNFITHGDPGTAYMVTVDATFALARNVYGVVGVRDIFVFNDGEGDFVDLSGFIGITMAFGGSGTLRDAMSATPMLSSTLPSFTALAASMVD